MQNYFVVRTGGKQYLVSEGKTLEVEKLAGEAGQKITFDDVLLTVAENKVDVGRPTLKTAKVEAEILEQKKGKKVVAAKFHAKSRYHRKVGHRQQLTKVKITKINI